VHQVGNYCIVIHHVYGMAISACPEEAIKT